MVRWYPLFAFLCFTYVLAAQPALEFATVATGFNSPVDITAPNDGTDRLFVVEQGGTVRIVDQLSSPTNRTVLPTPFLTLGSPLSSGGERGLLGLAFHPGYAANGYFFVNYTVNTGGQLKTRISRFTRSAANTNVADGNSELLFLEFDQPYGNHNAGDLAFGPDGMLYITTGDGGSGGDPLALAQNRSSIHGNILRLDVDTPDATAGTNYSIPTDNPYAGNTNGWLEEIWSYGWRNPWRFSFDRQTGDMWVADVGQGNREEVSFEAAGTPGGANYGWKCKEGLSTFSSNACVSGATLTDPVFDYPHDNTGGYSVTGGFVYRGADYPALQGYYVVTDFYLTNNFWLVDAATRQVNYQSVSGLNQISTFGESADGELYLAEYSNGTIKQVFTNAVLPVALTAFTARRDDRQAVQLRWTTATEQNSSHFEVERAGTDRRFETIGRVAAAGFSSAVRSYTFVDAAPLAGPAYYRLRAVDLDGSATLSRTVSVASERVVTLQVGPNPSLGEAYARLSGATGNVQWTLHDQVGRRLFHLRGGSEWRIHDLPGGTYLLTAETDGDRYTRRLVVE